MSDRLELWGRPLFAHGLMADLLEQQVREQVRARYAAIALTRRPISPLQVRRAMVAMSFPGAVTVRPGGRLTMIAVGGIGDRRAAQHVSAIEGDPALLDVAPGRVMPARHPVGVVDGDRLIVTVFFTAADRPFAPLLVHAELTMIEAMLAAQRAELARFNARLPELVRRLVKEEWEGMTQGAPPR